MRDHAFITLAEAVDSTPAASFLTGCSVAPSASLFGPLRTRTPNSSGAKHRSCSCTKLNAGSRLHYPCRSRGLHPGCKLPHWLLRRAFRILVRTPTNTHPEFFRCEAPFLLLHEIECGITPSLPLQKPWTPPRLQASSLAAPSRLPHPCSDPYEHAPRILPVRSTVLAPARN